MTSSHIQFPFEGWRRRKGKGDVTPTNPTGPTTTVPGVPTSVTATRTDTVGTLNWQPPASDGGLAITGYVVERVNFASGTVASTARTTTFNNLSATTDYILRVAAVNGNGTGPWASVNLPKTQAPVVAARFPGDPGKGSGSIYFGIDEFDKDPMVKVAAEDAAPEALARVRAGSIREYYSTWSAFGSTGGVWNAIKEHHSKGRVPWVSTHNGESAGNWATSLGSGKAAMVAIFDYFIARCESAEFDKPIWVSLIHEPENQTISKGGHTGTETEWMAIQRVFRDRMNAFEAANGGIGNYRWKNLAFSNCMTAYCYQQTTNAGGIDRYVPNQASADVFDFLAADYYVWTVGAPTWGGNIVGVVNFAKKYNKPAALGEWGIHHENPDAGARLRDFYARCLDPANNIFAILYYNSAVSNTSRALLSQRWMLNNGGTFTYTNDTRPQPVTYSNGQMLNAFVALMKDTRSIHFWDCVNPATGQKYPKPAGATF